MWNPLNIFFLFLTIVFKCANDGDIEGLQPCFWYISVDGSKTHNTSENTVTYPQNTGENLMDAVPKHSWTRSTWEWKVFPHRIFPTPPYGAICSWCSCLFCTRLCACFALSHDSPYPAGGVYLLPLSSTCYTHLLLHNKSCDVAVICFIMWECGIL